MRERIKKIGRYLWIIFKWSVISIVCLTILLIISIKTIRFNCEEKCQEINARTHYSDPLNPDRKYPINIILTKEEFKDFATLRMIGNFENDNDLIVKSLRLSKVIIKTKMLGNKAFITNQAGTTEEIELK